MNGNWGRSLRCIVLILATALLYGCTAAQKQIPHFGFGKMNIEARMDRGDLIVLRSVEGESSTTSVLAGLLQIIDGDKVKLFYIPFFKDKYTYFSDSIFGGFPLLNQLRLVHAEDRAYYKALEKTPDADVVFYKSNDREGWGIPILFTTESVTWRGKALKVKPDN